MRPADRPSWVDEVMPGRIVAASRLPWGFHNESWIVTGPDGRQVVATRFVHGTSRAMPALLAALQPRLAAVGVPIPTVDLIASSRRPDVIVSDVVDGEPGAALLGADSGPRLIGAITGRVWRRLADVDPAGLELPGLWSQADRLVEGAQTWAKRVSPDLSTDEQAILGSAIATLARSGASRPGSLVHGDLVPVNVLVRDGRIAGLLDFESARVGDPLLDAAWFAWIVRFHHPGAFADAWAGFSTEAGLDDPSPTVRELLGVLPIVRILELLDLAPAGNPARAAWLTHLRASVRSVSRVSRPSATAGR